MPQMGMKLNYSTPAMRFALVACPESLRGLQIYPWPEEDEMSFFGNEGCDSVGGREASPRRGAL